MGRIGDREGAFVLQHWGVCSEHGVERSGGRIVAGSGTDDLVGIRGTVGVYDDATGANILVLQYEFTRDQRG